MEDQRWRAIERRAETASDCLGRIQGRIDRMAQQNVALRRREKHSKGRDCVGRRGKSGGMEDELEQLSRITRDLRCDYHRMRSRSARDWSIEELAELNASF
jgi:hypothetical protein